MSAYMSGHLVGMGEHAEAHQDSLAERMARSPLSLVEVLRCATEVAAALRDLHRQGLAYGAVSSQLIELGPSGATLRPTGVRKHLGDGRRDVGAFGAVLHEMLRRAETAGGGLESLREEARALARRCCNESPPMQHVLTALRLLAFEARQCGTGVRPMPRRAVVQPMPATAAPVETLRLRARVGIRIRTALHWKPLASLAAVCARAAL